MGPSLEIAVALDAGETGWVRFALQVGPNAFEYEISDLTDALGDLLRATLHIVCGGEVAQWAFELEPGECKVRLERVVEPLAILDGLRITITEKRYPSAGEGCVRELFVARCTPDRFGAAVLAQANAILHQVGFEAFRTRWGRPFPLRAFEALRLALSTPSA
ncbi:hypothetical protein GALL_523350 [mine drainage metagenome]|uniref:Uncharacterized protein n=1 Tax=mine drainage metagenome TaxID=410659 RepID=A0A1J5PLE1_9ZZZZ